MPNFEAELNRLLSLETRPLPDSESIELAAAGQELLAEFNKKQADTSLQIEEIYDLVKEQDFLQKTAMSEKDRADQMVPVAIGLADLLEDFYVYAGRSGSDELKAQAKLLWENAGAILSSRGILRFGREGEALDPRIHTVKASVESPVPREQVVQVLQSGYVYQNTIIRKAAVVVSRGQEADDYQDQADDQELTEQHEQTGEGDTDGQNSWY
ncbi:MAG: nucleotide exchange factor GrpE [Treponema sp.]|jgi:molecular chaperone GrpE (heat shock protein)|nr:nucleotide exchange factor GrpE [Treponema sp.]